MSSLIRRYKINGVPSRQKFDALSFIGQIEWLKAFKAFKERAKKIHISQKRQSYTKAIQDAKRLNDVLEYYCEFNASSDYFDDTFEFYFTSKESCCV